MDIKGIPLHSLSLDELRRLVDASAQPARVGAEPARAAGADDTAPAIDPGEAVLALDPWTQGAARALPWPPPPPNDVAASARLDATVAFVLDPLR